jgi:solute carrier family 45 protein 1/2/4
MPSNAQWVGTPKVKGSSESMRMALLTASLIGLQYVHRQLTIVRASR